ncbi:hypothetical protein VIGAN_03048800 [Vigna angularis var. angularis]|uniref:RIN4 pathogenic type III effector avirulence factor Avr cleavage site domain-containing protein n=1 Tax=Vigna angularis var. angularis TaxID=157739 RepID=A0A0S3RJV3_PHAAN|nr:hypothetical protein VIGAN_03048800 [Vigna angularis var. angularis]
MGLNEKDIAIISVPDFGGEWNQKAQRATNYSTVFTQAQKNKKHKKTKCKCLENEREFSIAKHGQAPFHHAYVQEDLMKKKRIITYINCCIRPTIVTP